MDGGSASPSPARDRVGQQLGRYRLEAVLGAGGTSVVYRALDVATGNQVALKLLHDYLARSPDVCRRFIREAKLSSHVDHPGMVGVLDDGETDDGTAYIVLELLQGETLEDRRVRAGGMLPLDEVLAYADHLLAVLEVAHLKNVIHRDIKPANLWLTNDGTLKVLDFGIARIIDEGSASSTKTGQMVGTPAFMPPEQALSRPREVDPRTDLWAVGATIFTLLSGELVHLAESSSEHLVKAATARARSLADALPGVPANVEWLVGKSLAFDKNERWSSATEMRRELARVRRDPGHRIGISTAPPRSSHKLRAEQPTFVTAENSSGRISLANMSIPGLPSDARTRHKRSVLGFVAGAVAIAALLAGAFGFVVAMKMTRTASAARSVATPQPPPPAFEPPPSIDLPPPETVPPPPPTMTATASLPTATAAPHARTSAATPQTPAKKTPTTKPAASIDVYRPF